MADTSDTRVAIHIDFDNIVISRYDQLHGLGGRTQKINDLDPADPETPPAARPAPPPCPPAENSDHTQTTALTEADRWIQA